MIVLLADLLFLVVIKNAYQKFPNGDLEYEIQN